MKSEWSRLWVAWTHAAGQLPEDVSASAAAVLRSARAWRRLFQAATGMKAIFPSTDPVWQPLSQRLSECEVYMQHLYMALAQHLRCHVRFLRAAEEVSRVGSLSTVVYTVLSDGRLRRSSTEMRELQATVLESLGWSACPSELAAEIAELGRRGAELTLDYAKNLLQQCETACMSSSLRQLCEIQDDQPLQRSEAWTGIQKVKEGASRMPHLHVWRVYHELCSWLLLPRVEEVTHVWAGLAQRGWDSARVDALWDAETENSNSNPGMVGPHNAGARAFKRAAFGSRGSLFHVIPHSDSRTMPLDKCETGRTTTRTACEASGASDGAALLQSPSAKNQGCSSW
ncbi:unnamed protein product [Symbiodinium sp. CCMP2456]|nr:unnamed protein product [Symbiodinium sp. CCMP2456]